MEHRAESAAAKVARIRAAIAARAAAARAPRTRGAHFSKAQPPGLHPNGLVLGTPSQGAPVIISTKARLEHAHYIGATGSGKTTLFEFSALQDILAGHGVCVVDPHGNHPDSLYRRLVARMSKWKPDRLVHLIDPSMGSHVVGFNPLEIPPGVDISTVTAAAAEAVERAWGDENTDEKPTLKRALEGTFSVLAECGLTIAEARLLLKRADRSRLRDYLRANVRDPVSLDFLERLDELAEDWRAFDAEVVAPLNRLNRFTRSHALRALIGQRSSTLDLRAALDEGHIVLVNLGGSGQVYERDAALLGRLLVRFLFFHASRRAHPERPFFLYLDECQKYLSGDVEALLAEARKYGLGVVLAHQFLRQLGDADSTTRHALLNTTNLKVVFRMQGPDEAVEMARIVTKLNYETPVEASLRQTVVGHERVRLNSESRGAQTARGTSQGRAVGQTDVRGEATTTMEAYSDMSVTSQVDATGTATNLSAGQVMEPAQGFFASQPGLPNPGFLAPQPMVPNRGLFARPIVLSQSTGESESESISKVSGTSEGTSHTSGIAETVNWSRALSQSDSTAAHQSVGETSSAGWSEAFEPVYAPLYASFHSLPVIEAMAADRLRALPTGHAAATFVDGTRVHLTLAVPLVAPLAVSDGQFQAMRAALMNASPSAKPAADAAREVEERERALFQAARRHAAEARRAPPDPETFREPAKPRKLRPPRG